MGIRVAARLDQQHEKSVGQSFGQLRRRQAGDVGDGMARANQRVVAVQRVGERGQLHCGGRTRQQQSGRSDNGPGGNGRVDKVARQVDVAAITPYRRARGRATCPDSARRGVM